MKKFLTVKAFVLLLPFIGALIALVALNTIIDNQTVSLILSAAVFFFIIGARFWFERQTPALIDWLGDFVVTLGYLAPTQTITPQQQVSANDHYRLAHFFIDQKLTVSRKDANDNIFYKYRKVEVAAVSPDGWHIIRAKVISPRAITDLTKVKKALSFICSQIDQIADDYDKEAAQLQSQLAAEKAKMQAQQNNKQNNGNGNGNNNGQQQKQNNGNNNGKQNGQWQQPQQATITRVPNPNDNNQP